MSCYFLYEGVRSVLGPQGCERIEISQRVRQKDGEERHTYPLRVTAWVGLESSVEVHFYTDNRKCSRTVSNELRPLNADSKCA